MVFPVVIYGCESWTIRKAECLRAVVLGKILESSMDCKEIQLVHSKEDQSCVFFGRNDAKAETPVFWPPHMKSWHTGKSLMLGGIGGRRKSGRQRMRWLDGVTPQWTWVWVNSGSWWWTGRPVMLWLMGLQRVWYYWATEMNWTCLLSQWRHPTISSSVVPFSCLQSFPASRSFQMIQLFASGGQSIGASASASKFQWVDTSLFGPSSFWRGLREVKSTFLLVHINKDNLELRLYKQRDWCC